jgi:hypothetical protein
VTLRGRISDSQTFRKKLLSSQGKETSKVGPSGTHSNTLRSISDDTRPQKQRCEHFEASNAVQLIKSCVF